MTMPMTMPVISYKVMMKELEISIIKPEREFEGDKIESHPGLTENVHDAWRSRPGNYSYHPDLPDGPEFNHGILNRYDFIIFKNGQYYHSWRGAGFLVCFKMLPIDTWKLLCQLKQADLDRNKKKRFTTICINHFCFPCFWSAFLSKNLSIYRFNRPHSC